MGLLNLRRRARPEAAEPLPPPTPMRTCYVSGNGVVDVVGESYYQENIGAIVGPKAEDPVRRAVPVDLVPEPNNPYDKNAADVSDGSGEPWIREPRRPRHQPTLDLHDTSRRTVKTLSGDVESRPFVDDSGDHHDDRAAIEAVIANVEDGFNTNDAEVSCRDFTANARTITALGSRVAGWEALLDAHRAGFAGPLGDQYARYRLDDVVFLRPDVALAFKQAWATGTDGTALTADPAMVALYVLVRVHGRWWIAARANTLVQPVSPDPS
jgi:uncharacterized protein (TIGR02246 family)